jgi:hypothetical protein
MSLFTESPFSIATYANKLQEGMEKAKKTLNDYPPEELLLFLDTEFKNSYVLDDVNIDLYAEQGLTTIKKIATFGNRNLNELIETFPVSLLVKGEVIDFLKQIIIITDYIRIEEEEKMSKEADLSASSPDSNDYL